MKIWSDEHIENETKNFEGGQPTNKYDNKNESFYIRKNTFKES